MLIAANRSSPSVETVSTPELHKLLDREPIEPVKQPTGLSASKVALGKALFNDCRLSDDNTVSCASCHNLVEGGSDHRKVSTGVHGRKTKYNSLTVINAVLNSKLTWQGKTGSIYEQTEQLVANPSTLGSSWPTLEAKLSADKAMQAQFMDVYHSNVSRTNIIDAIVEYEKSLCAENSRFDLYLKGNTKSITQEELEGYKLFKAYGCASCHQGMNVGGNMFIKFGIFGDYFKPEIPANCGRFELTKKEEDRFVFRVPSLRNVELTAPYFHDGSVQDLEEAVSIMATYQLGRELPAGDRQKIVSFLKTLTALPEPAHEK